MFDSRYYQVDANKSISQEYDAGNRRLLLQMATGTGKTICFSRLQEQFKDRLPGQMIVLAHTEELVTQNLKKLIAANPGLKVGKEMAGEYADPDCDIISACVKTTGRQGTKRNERFNWNNIDKIVIDEAHHSVGDDYQRVLEWVGINAPGSDKLLVGVTATTQRPDGRALSEIYDKVAYVYGLRKAIEDGFLVRVRGFRVSTDTSLDEVSVSSGDFSVTKLAAAVNTPARNRQVVEQWKKLAEGRQTICFTADIDHAKAMAKEFNESGVPAEAVWGEDPEREAKIKRHQNGETRVLCNCAVLVEGYDDPSISCVVLARPTTSSVAFSQMVGRGTRLYPGKVDLIVIDVVDATSKNSLITLPTLIGLQAELDLRGHDLVETAEEIEAAQAEHPGVDFSKLVDIAQLKTLVEQVNMFEVRFPAEVEENSELTWFKAIDGGYKMLVPKDGPEPAGWMRIYQNPLGVWDIVGKIKNVNLQASRGSMEEAFKATDEQLRKRLSKMTFSYIKREATWHNKPVTSGQIKMLAKLFPKKLFPLEQMTAGMASKIISERLSKRIKN
jgi:superfamily II DNA or RNA helicase